MIGTKTNPGSYDCYGQADLDEPMFVLLGRDPDAPDLVRRWASARESRGEAPAKVASARAIAAAMDTYQGVENSIQRLRSGDLVTFIASWVAGGAVSAEEAVLALSEAYPLLDRVRIAEVLKEEVETVNEAARPAAHAQKE